MDGDLESRPPFPMIFLARVQDKAHGHDIRDEQTFVFKTYSEVVCTYGVCHSIPQAE